MLEVWIPLLGCMLVGYGWYHVMQLRERVIVHVRALCAQHDLQLLDDSVALERLYTRWRKGTLQVLRQYRFDTSLDGQDRRSAHITLSGNRVVTANLPQREAAATSTTVAASFDITHQVAPVARMRRTLP